MEQLQSTIKPIQMTTIPHQDRERYRLAYEAYNAAKFPEAIKAGGQLKCKYPDTRKANGLTNFIVNYITWIGYRATRINSTGRVIDAPQKQQSGTVLTVKKWIPGTTRKGTADVSATIKGRSAMFEVKVGRDKPSIYQLAEQQREQLAGGIYEFIHDTTEFFAVLDKVLNVG